MNKNAVLVEVDGQQCEAMQVPGPNSDLQWGYMGMWLGAGGSWNVNEEKAKAGNPPLQIGTRFRIKQIQDPEFKPRYNLYEENIVK